MLLVYDVTRQAVSALRAQSSKQLQDMAEELHRLVCRVTSLSLLSLYLSLSSPLSLSLNACYTPLSCFSPQLL